MFRNAATDLDNRRLLKRIGANDRRGDLTGDGNQRHAVQFGVGDGRDQVRGTRTAGGHAHAGPPGRPRVALGGKTAPLLVPRQYRADPVLYRVSAWWIGMLAPPG